MTRLAGKTAFISGGASGIGAAFVSLDVTSESGWESVVADAEAQLGGFGLKAADVAKYRADFGEPVYDTDDKPRADFFTENS